MFKTLIFVFLFFLAFAPAVAGQEKYVRFVDEAAKDKSFSDFREKLLAAVRARDEKFVLSVLDPQIQNNFGGGAGIADFKKTWKLSNRNSEFWDEMLRVLSNGGAFMDKKKQTFGAPYLYALPLPDNLDLFDHAAIFGENVNLRQQPDANSPIVAALSYNVVKPNYDRSVKDKSRENEYLWIWVETLGGKKGYVAGQYVRSPIDYRAVFEKKNGRWKMTAFIAGD